MPRQWMALAGLAFLLPWALADDDLRKKPITTDTGTVGKLLTLWFVEGSAAGNAGDWYDNRDGEHSPLDLRPYPQLRKVTYTDEEIKQRRHWAMQTRTLPHVVFGNSSTSGPPEQNGSNPRTYYVHASGLRILESHYRRNNLYIYPEHRDHDPGHNGVGDGYGDLYPTNTPYLLISQGSSGSDQPFMRALPFTLAAFRPEVKKKLIETGLLMPTVQMVFRSSNNHLTRPEEYLTGKAHPTVFEGKWVDPVKMVQTAHAIRLGDIPPLVKLSIKEETKPENGRDYFEPVGRTEQHSDTTSVIARVWRGSARNRKLVVSATSSRDVNDRPLTFRWVVLRGDEKRIHIQPRNRTGSEVEITVAYHERCPVSPGATLESNRVDVGVFAHNGVYYSAPGFLTFFSLDSESRTYDDKDRIIEIGHGMGETELKVTDLAGLCAALVRNGLPARLLGLSAGQRADLGTVAIELKTAQATLASAKRKRKEAEAVRTRTAAAYKEAESRFKELYDRGAGKGELRDANEAVVQARNAALRAAQTSDALAPEQARAEAAVHRLTEEKRPVLHASTRAFLQTVLRRAVQSPTLWNEHREALMERLNDPANRQREGRVTNARRKLLQLGIVVNGANRVFRFQAVRPGTGRPEDRLTTFARAMLEEHNAVLLTELVLPGLVTGTFRLNHVDARLSARKNWRDVYHYEGGQLVGWTRHHVGPTNIVSEFTPEGWLVMKKDDQGRPIEVRPVRYLQDAPPGPVWANTNPLRQVTSDEVITISYEGGKRKVKGWKMTNF